MSWKPIARVQQVFLTAELLHILYVSTQADEAESLQIPLFLFQKINVFYTCSVPLCQSLQVRSCRGAWHFVKKSVRIFLEPICMDSCSISIASQVSHSHAPAGIHVSCKSIFVAALVKELHSKGHRTLIFSQSRVMLDIMGSELRRMELAFLRIDGTLSGAQREAISLTPEHALLNCKRPAHTPKAKNLMHSRIDNSCTETLSYN